MEGAAGTGARVLPGPGGQLQPRELGAGREERWGLPEPRVSGSGLLGLQEHGRCRALGTGARAKAGSCLVPLFCRKKLGTETRAATLSHVGVLYLQAAHQPGPWSRLTGTPLSPGLPHRALSFHAQHCP